VLEEGCAQPIEALAVLLQDRDRGVLGLVEEPPDLGVDEPPCLLMRSATRPARSTRSFARRYRSS